jgi:putative sterol carrier protein
MTLEAFSEQWAAAWKDELNASAAYRQAAARWEGAVVVVLTGGPGAGERAVFLDLHRGECRAARVATPQDRDTAPFVIAADPESWRQLLAGAADPVGLVMRGKLRLLRGSAAQILPQVDAAKELVNAAARIESTFPES